MAKAGSNSDRFVGYDPDLPPRKALHLHWETHRRIERPQPHVLQCGRNFSGHFVDVIAGVVKFEVR
jgi:hypothetical protein